MLIHYLEESVLDFNPISSSITEIIGLVLGLGFVI